ncbi:MAG TPA: protein kinase [Gemmatimonadales bacterium]|nr:protein kinase [Gemmatimonadales bacterium]
MLRLSTLGGLVLHQDGQLHTGPAAQRRRLALLAVIASAGRRGVGRDRLLSLLWPGSEPEAARHSLYQALHAVRRSLGGDDVFLGSATLQLNPERITSDIGEFLDAVEEGAHERAVRLYRGPFLDGFRLDQAPEFDEWQDAERVRHAREFAAALEQLAAAAAARQDHAAAARWWRRLAAAEPVSTTAAVGLIESLVAAGDRVGALQFAGVHTALVRQHLETEPDPAVESWLVRLRSGDLPASADARPAPPRSRGATGAEEARAAAARELQEIRRALADRFEVADRVAESTMLLTFAARDRRDTRPVELHVLTPRLASLAPVDRVLAALERVTALHDPRIVPIRDCGLLQGIVWFATPPVEGTSLRERLARDRQLPLDEALRHTRDLLEVLVYAHGRDVRHGDLRPKHVMLGRTGLTVASFGLVEALDAAASRSTAGSTAVTIGAPAYLSPEQLAGETTADERSDLYSLACVAFEMLAGEPPFGGASLASVLSRKLTQAAPSVRSLRDSVPPAVDTLLARCLSRLPADRYQSAREAYEALQAAR